MPTTLIYDHAGNRAGQLLSLADYAERIAGKSYRTVQRWLADGELPDARQDDDGRWWVPADAQRRRTTSHDVVETTTAQPVAVRAPDAPATPWGQLRPLEEVARELGTTVGGVRRMADAGLLVVGPFGPNGALRAHRPA